MSDTKDAVRPEAPPEEKQFSATTPEPPPGNTPELSDADLAKVAGGFLGNLVRKVKPSIKSPVKLSK